MTKEAKIPEYKKVLVRQIREHATAHYGQGWDELVEAWTDLDIILAFGRAYTFESCLTRVRAELDARRELYSTYE